MPGGPRRFQRVPAEPGTYWNLLEPADVLGTQWQTSSRSTSGYRVLDRVAGVSDASVLRRQVRYQQRSNFVGPLGVDPVPAVTHVQVDARSVGGEDALNGGR